MGGAFFLLAELADREANPSEAGFRRGVSAGLRVYDIRQQYNIMLLRMRAGFVLEDRPPHTLPSLRPAASPDHMVRACEAALRRFTTAG